MLRIARGHAQKYKYWVVFTERGGVRAQLHMQQLINQHHTLILTIREVNLSKTFTCKQGHLKARRECVHSAQEMRVEMTSCCATTSCLDF